MSTIDELRARRRAHALLGALLVQGLDPARLEAVRALPTLAEHLPRPVDLDALAAEHHALLGRELPPYAGVFLDDEGLVGRGKAAAILRAAHAAVGVACPDDPGPDHLGVALQLLAVLVDAELDARAHDDAADVRTLGGWQRRVLDEALLPWMPPLLVALRGQPPSLWTWVVELAVGVAADHRHADGSLPTVEAVEVAPGGLEHLLDDPRTGLRAVAEALGTAARCGVHLTRRDLDVVARRSGLPRGFGGRRDTLEALLRAAAEYGVMPRLIAQLDALLAARDDGYAALAQEPGLAEHVPGWRRRLAATRGLLARLSDAALVVREHAVAP